MLVLLTAAALAPRVPFERLAAGAVGIAGILLLQAAHDPLGAAVCALLALLCGVSSKLPPSPPRLSDNTERTYALTAAIVVSLIVVVLSVRLRPEAPPGPSPSPVPQPRADPGCGCPARAAIPSTSPRSSSPRRARSLRLGRCQ